MQAFGQQGLACRGAASGGRAASGAFRSALGSAPLPWRRAPRGCAGRWRRGAQPRPQRCSAARPAFPCPASGVRLGPPKRAHARVLQVPARLPPELPQAQAQGSAQGGRRGPGAGGRAGAHPAHSAGVRGRQLEHAPGAPAAPELGLPPPAPPRPNGPAAGGLVLPGLRGGPPGAAAPAAGHGLAEAAVRHGPAAAVAHHRAGAEQGGRRGGGVHRAQVRAPRGHLPGAAGGRQGRWWRGWRLGRWGRALAARLQLVECGSGARRRGRAEGPGRSRAEGTVRACLGAATAAAARRCTRQAAAAQRARPQPSRPASSRPPPPPPLPRPAPARAPLPPQKHHSAREVFLTVTSGHQYVASVLRKAWVHPPADFAAAFDGEEGNDVFMCEYEYDEAWRRFRRAKQVGGLVGEGEGEGGGGCLGAAWGLADGRCGGLAVLQDLQAGGGGLLLRSRGGWEAGSRANLGGMRLWQRACWAAARPRGSARPCSRRHTALAGCAGCWRRRGDGGRRRQRLRCVRRRAGPELQAGGPAARGAPGQVRALAPGGRGRGRGADRLQAFAIAGRQPTLVATQPATRLARLGVHPCT
jgi:hypothetical protein